jgi:hypothetical protein
MTRFNDEISPERLIEAAEACIRAIVEVWRRRGGRCPYPPDLLGCADEPNDLEAFTRREIEEASEFLARLGFIDRPRWSRTGTPRT